MIFTYALIAILLEMWDIVFKKNISIYIKINDFFNHKF